MIYDNEFTCPDGHTFKANAKLRARCPTCGKLAKRFNKGKVPTLAVVDVKQVEPDVIRTIVEPVEPVESALEPRTVKLLKQGRPRAMPARKMPPRVNGRFVSAKKAVKKTVVKAKTQGLVKRHAVKGKVSPAIKRPPSRTAIARHIGDKLPKSYQDMMIESSRY